MLFPRLSPEVPARTTMEVAAVLLTIVSIGVALYAYPSD